MEFNESEHGDCLPDIVDRPETHMVDGDATNNRTEPDTRIGRRNIDLRPVITLTDRFTDVID